MRNKILGCLAVLAVAAVAAWNVNVSSQTKGMSDVMLANVEALAQENGGDADCSDGWARVTCPIWTVTLGGNGCSCTTGGSWKCPC